MEENYVILQVGDTVNPDLVKTHKVPYDWVNPTISERKGETHFSKVDNPSIWSGFSFNLCLRMVCTRHVLSQLDV